MLHLSKLKVSFLEKVTKQWRDRPQLTSNFTSRACAQPQASSSGSGLCHAVRKLMFKERKECVQGDRTSKQLTVAQNSVYLTTKPRALNARLCLPVTSHPLAANVPAPLTPNRDPSVTK